MENKKNITFPTVKVFTTDNCPFCFTLKEFLETYNVKFEEINISKDKKAKEEIVEKLRKKGIRGSVPILEINQEIIVGFDRNKICELLNIKE